MEQHRQQQLQQQKSPALCPLPHPPASFGTSSSGSQTRRTSPRHPAQKRRTTTARGGKQGIASGMLMRPGWKNGRLVGQMLQRCSTDDPPASGQAGTLLMRFLDVKPTPALAVQSDTSGGMQAEGINATGHGRCCLCNDRGAGGRSIVVRPGQTHAPPLPPSCAAAPLPAPARPAPCNRRHDPP